MEYDLPCPSSLSQTARLSALRFLGIVLYLKEIRLTTNKVIITIDYDTKKHYQYPERVFC